MVGNARGTLWGWSGTVGGRCGGGFGVVGNEICADFAWSGSDPGGNPGRRSVTVDVMSTVIEPDLGACVVLTVEEAAGVLRIGRSLAYQLAAEYEASGGVSGLPVIRVGGCLRVPKWALIELAMTGRVVRLCDTDIATLIEHGEVVGVNDAP